MQDHEEGFEVRDAAPDDLPSMAAMAAALVRFHHAIDPARYLIAQGVEEGYLRWFEKQRENPDALLLVAAQGATRLGYLYAEIADRDWNLLLDRHVTLHDIFVRPEARRRGVADRLLDAFTARVDARGVPRAVLHTAVQNEAAQALFRARGFRPTMIEMMRERPSPDA